MGLNADTKLIEGRIDALMAALEKNYYRQYPRNAECPDYLKHEVRRGTKYYKIIQLTSRGNGQYGASVHAFVHRQTGAVYKPASWQAPAAHVRYTLTDDASYQECLQRADWAGGYLYLK